jgi:hypothetical protein
LVASADSPNSNVSSVPDELITASPRDWEDAVGSTMKRSIWENGVQVAPVAPLGYAAWQV